MGFMSDLVSGTQAGQQQAYVGMQAMLPALQQYSAQNYNYNLAPDQTAVNAYSGQANSMPAVSNLTNQINKAQNATGAASANAYAPGTTANIGSMGATAASYLNGQMNPAEKQAMNEYSSGPGGFSSQTQTPGMNAFNFQNNLVQQGANLNQQALNQTQQVNGPQANIGSNFQSLNGIGQTAQQLSQQNTGLQNQIGQMNTGLANQQTLYNTQAQSANNQASATNSFINTEAGKTSGGLMNGLQNAIMANTTGMATAMPGQMMGFAGGIMGGMGGGGGGGNPMAGAPMGSPSSGGTSGGFGGTMGGFAF